MNKGTGKKHFVCLKQNDEYSLKNPYENMYFSKRRHFHLQLF